MNYFYGAWSGGCSSSCPVAIIVIVITRLAATIRVALHSIMAAPQMAAIFHGPWAVESAVLVVLLLCMVTGLVLNLPYMQHLIASADRSLAKQFPSYNLLRGFEARAPDGKGRDARMRGGSGRSRRCTRPRVCCRRTPDGLRRLRTVGTGAPAKAPFTS